MKNKRQSRILDIISSQIILRQEDLQEALMKEGLEVTQSTISRDIKELCLVKGRDANGNYRYLCADSGGHNSHSADHYRDIYVRAVKSVDYALNNVVIKCYPGMASGAAVAVDALFGDRILGSLAGDDTILIITRSEEASAQLLHELKSIF